MSPVEQFLGPLAVAVLVSFWRGATTEDVAAFVYFPPAEGSKLAQVEHYVFLFVAWRVLCGIGGLAALGPAKAWKKIAGTVFGSLKVLPGMNALVGKGMEKEMAMIRKDLLGDGDKDAQQLIPSKGISRADVKLKLEAAKGTQAKHTAWGGIYHEDGGELSAVQADAWALFNCSNTLYPATFPGVRKFEAEVVSMVLGLVQDSTCANKAVGLLTSGGTESIMIAVLAYRNEARARGIDEPEIVCGLSAHPALTKACHYFNVKQVKLPMNPSTFALDPSLVAKAINRNTVCVYASAPSFTHGVVDPVHLLGPICKDKGVGLHVDNCLGGFLLSFLAKAGHFAKPWDFNVEGVTSMSVDVHKYGYASKGVSVVAFRDPALRRASYAPSVDGCEGLYVTPTLQGSRSGATIAQAWATLLATGIDGYEKMAADHWYLLQRAKDAVESIPELQLLVVPDAAILPVVARKNSGISIYAVASALEKKGWNMFTGQHPPVMSVCFGEQHLKSIDQWCVDLNDSVAHVKAHPNEKLEGQCAVYGAAQTLPDDILDTVLRSYVDIKMEVKAA